MSGQSEGRFLLELKEAIVAAFTQENWLELGALTDSLDLIRGHGRLLRSLHWQDPDYGGHALSVLAQIIQRDSDNLVRIDKYVRDRVQTHGDVISSVAPKGQRLVFAPQVFEVPTTKPDVDLVSVMMPFAAEFDLVFSAIEAAVRGERLECLRADDVWEHSVVVQDVFSLIFRSNIVVCDFTNRNANVFYEAGIAHTLGKHVVPVAQSENDIPFDLRHHRYIRYLNNDEGRNKLRIELAKRLRSLRDLSDG